MFSKKTPLKCFLIARGQSGACFVLNLSSLRNLLHSIRFYKTISLRNAFIKVGIYVFAFAHYVFSKVDDRYLKSPEDIDFILNQGLIHPALFNVDGDCSILKSSDGGKVIVNHHDLYFEKFFFGDEALRKANSEINAYHALELNQSNYFKISRIVDEAVSSGYCAFKLINNFEQGKQIFPNSNYLVCALAELFVSHSKGAVKVAKVLKSLKDHFLLRNISLEFQLGSLLDSLIVKCGEAIIPIGFEHGDFKVWNLNFYKSFVHIYDFEESRLEGFPLMDLLTFCIDPLVMHGKSDRFIFEKIFSKNLNQMMDNYLQRLNVKVNRDLLILIYFLRRSMFYEGKAEGNRFLTLANNFSYVGNLRFE